MSDFDVLLFRIVIRYVNGTGSTNTEAGIPQERKKHVSKRGVLELLQVVEYLVGTLGVKHRVAGVVLQVRENHILHHARIDQFHRTTPLEEDAERAEVLVEGNFVDASDLSTEYLEVVNVEAVHFTDVVQALLLAELQEGIECTGVVVVG